MWNSRKSPLAVVSFVALCLTVTVAIELDAAPDAVDYHYDGCHQEAMREFNSSGLLQKELDSSVEFQTAWNTKCGDAILGVSTEHTAALSTYGNEQFSKIFNDAVATMGTNRSTYEHFPFKSMHFLLMDALRLAKKDTCKNVYIISDETYTAMKGSQIRFGRFMTVKTDTSHMDDFWSGTFLNITTCFYLDLPGFCNMDEDAGLLSPSEMFTVEDARVVKTPDGDKYTKIVLKHSKLQFSNYCSTYSRSPADIPTTWLVLLLVTLFPLVANC